MSHRSIAAAFAGSVALVWASVLVVLVADYPASAISPGLVMVAIGMGVAAGIVLGWKERARGLAQSREGAKGFVWTTIGACIVATSFTMSRPVLFVSTQAFALSLFVVYGVPSLLRPMRTPDLHIGSDGKADENGR